MNEPVSIIDLFRDVVAKVSENMTATLKEYDPTITGVHYMAGHPLEVTNRLSDRGKNGKAFEKYPLIALFLDVPEEKNAGIGFESEIRADLIIARSTASSLIAEERDTKNFKPVLDPIYREFMKQINEITFGHWKPFQTAGVTKIEHTKINRYFWGKETFMKNVANNFNDYIDCIEIRDLRLKINFKNC